MTTLESLTTYGKAELRAACKEHGIAGYSKMNNDGMRSALTEKLAEPLDPASLPHQTELDEEQSRGLGVEPVVTTPEKHKKIAVPKEPREERNGIKRPRAGGVCAEVWFALDAMLAAGESPTTQALKDLAVAKGWNQNNASTELSGWRRFNGVSARAPKAD